MTAAKTNDPVIKIIIADNHEGVLSTWKVLLEKNSLFRIISCCRDSQLAMDEARRLGPDIILVDVNMKPVNGFALTEKLKKELPAIGVIGMSVNNQPQYATQMIKSGARGFLTKTSALAEIYRAITTVYNGQTYICEEVRLKIKPTR